MITYRCTTCKRPLEVDDILASKKAACPHCQSVMVVPERSAQTTPDGVPFARAAGGKVDVVSQGDEEDRALALGLPPDSGPEQHVVTLHPAMFRARPMHGSGVMLLVLGGLGLTINGLIVHAQPYAQAWLWGGGVLLAVAAAWWLVWKVNCMTVALIITNKRTTLRRGILRRQTMEILHDKVQDLQITQSFAQRMAKVGTVGISSAGESGVEILVHDVPDPVRVREIIDAYREIG